jgi:hypothetical protein
MPRSRRRRGKRNLFKTIKRKTSKAVPVIKTTFKKVGTTVEQVALPAINKGLETVYNGLSTGLDMGVEGVKKGYKHLSKKNKRSVRRKM